MKAAESVAVSVKEKVQDAAVKVDERIDMHEPSAAEKVEKMTADEKADKQQIKARKHLKETYPIRKYIQKRAEHAAVKEQAKRELYQEEDDKQIDALNERTERQIPAADSTNTSASRSAEETANSFGGTQQNTDIGRSNLDQIPMHGSGVPTHSYLNGGETDTRRNEVMTGSPNTGSYL